MQKKHTKIISVILAIALVMSMCCVALVSVSAATGKIVVSLYPAQFLLGNDRYAVFANDTAGGDSCWYDPISSDIDEYTFEIDDRFDNMVFCRMSGAIEENDWHNVWDRTYDLKLDTTLDGAFYSITGKEDSGNFYLLGDWYVEEPTAPETEPETTVPETEPETTVPETEPETTEPPVERVLGDVDSDGSVTIKDAAMIQLYLAKLLSDPSVCDLTVADYNCDGDINIKDAALIQLVLEKLAEPVEPQQPTTAPTEPETTAPETEPETTAPETEPETTANKYVVVGEKEVFGVAWDGTAVANKMLDEDGDNVYSLTLTNVQPITDAEFMIVKNGTDWIGPKDAADPFERFKFTVEVPSDVTFIYDVVENEVSVNIVPVAAEETTVPTEPETTEPVEVASYYITGDPGLTGGPVDWQPDYLELEYNGDGTYSTTFYAIAEGSYTFKITDGTWDVQWGKDGVKDPFSDNYSITLGQEADVTITFDPSKESGAITVTTDPEEALTSFVLKYISTVGNGDGTWLNGANWAPDDATNIMTEVDPGVWEITYENVEAYNMYQVKFACNGSWTINWGADGTLNKADPQPYLTVDEDGTTVTLRIDVNGFDFDANTGTVDITMEGIHFTE